MSGVVPIGAIQGPDGVNSDHGASRVVEDCWLIIIPGPSPPSSSSNQLVSTASISISGPPSCPPRPRAGLGRAGHTPSPSRYWQPPCSIATRPASVIISSHQLSPAPSGSPGVQDAYRISGCGRANQRGQEGGYVSSFRSLSDKLLRGLRGGSVLPGVPPCCRSR